MIVLGLMLGFLSAILLSAFFSGLEIALYSANPTRLRALAADGNPSARYALEMQRRIAMLLTTILIANNIVNYSGTFFVTSFVGNYFSSHIELISTLIATPVLFILGEVLPKHLAHTYSEDYLTSSARVSKTVQTLLKPASIVLGFIGELIRKLFKHFGITNHSATGRLYLLQSFEAEMMGGSLSHQQMIMVKRIIALEQKNVGDVMLPINYIVSIGEEATCRAAAAKMTESGFNRILLTDRSGNLTGKILPFSSILRNAKHIDQPVSCLAIDAMRLSTNTAVAVAIEKMRERGSRVAIVISPGGNPVGIITNARLLSCFVSGLQKI